jgi:hypothetical protein
MCGRRESGRARHGHSGSRHPHPHPCRRLWPVGSLPLDPRYSPATIVPDLRDPARHNAGPPGPWGCGHQRFPALQSCAPDGGGAALPGRVWPSSRLPMGAVRAPPAAASGAGPREPVGNRTPIGPPDNRSASGQPIRDGRYGSGAFGVGLASDNRRTLGTGAASRPPARGWEDTRVVRSGTPSRQAREAQPGEAARRQPRHGGPGNGEGAPNKAALGGPSGLHLLLQ